jgi:hypothetical protein
MQKLHFWLVTLLLLAGCGEVKKEHATEQWSVFEVALPGPSDGNPYMEITVNAVFKNGETVVNVPGFYDGDGMYRIRFSPEHLGRWEYTTESNEEQLNNKAGSFDCIPATATNHGPVGVVNTFYLQYADSTPFYSVGTTAYQWTSVKKEIQEQTVASLGDAPFNKIRMCVFPKSYRYGNDTEPWMYPFHRDADQNDFRQPNYEFFQNFDRRIQQLLDLGIQADVILFHPYDKWGYRSMGKEMNAHYVRYMIARLSAFRNVWWSLANEWDVPEIKESIAWEEIGNLLQREDPHHRLRGIHNWYGSQDHFFDHTRPWITHVSTQTSQFYNALTWRNEYQKPLLFDEMRYEGDVPSGWGSLTAQEMVSYFWMAGLSGGYATHGETFVNPADDSTEVRWWAKGGVLVGQSVERIQFFRDILQQAPVTAMTPTLLAAGDSTQLNSNVYLFAKAGEFYLAYKADNNFSIALNLPAGGLYKAEVIDTWNMTITPLDDLYSGNTRIVLPGSPYLALRLTKQE